MYCDVHPSETDYQPKKKKKKKSWMGTNPLIVDRMEAFLNLNLQLIVRKGWDLK